MSLRTTIIVSGVIIAALCFAGYATTVRTTTMATTGGWVFDGKYYMTAERIMVQDWQHAGYCTIYDNILTWAWDETGEPNTKNAFYDLETETFLTPMTELGGTLYWTTDEYVFYRPVGLTQPTIYCFENETYWRVYSTVSGNKGDIYGDYAACAYGIFPTKLLLYNIANSSLINFPYWYQMNGYNYSNPQSPRIYGDTMAYTIRCNETTARLLALYDIKTNVTTVTDISMELCYSFRDGKVFGFDDIDYNQIRLYDVEHDEMIYDVYNATHSFTMGYAWGDIALVGTMRMGVYIEETWLLDLSTGEGIFLNLGFPFDVGNKVYKYDNGTFGIFYEREAESGYLEAVLFYLIPETVYYAQLSQFGMSEGGLGEYPWLQAPEEKNAILFSMGVLVLTATIIYSWKTGKGFKEDDYEEV